RHQVWSELDTAEAEIDGIREGTDHECLGQTGNPHEQAVAASEYGNYQLFQHTLLADNSLVQLLLDASIAVIEPLDGREVAFKARQALGFRGRYDLGHGHRFIARQPGATATKPPTAGRHLHHQATVLTLHGGHEEDSLHVDV